MERGAWWVVVHGVTKDLDITWQLNSNKNFFLKFFEIHITGTLISNQNILLLFLSNFYEQIQANNIFYMLNNVFSLETFSKTCI